MTAGWLNPLDDTRTDSARPAETNTGAGVRKWFSALLRTRPKAQDLNRILAPLRDVIDYFGVTDVEGDDTLLRQAIIKAFRVKLTTNTTYYVRTDGNDANSGLVDSPSGAFLTIQAALNKTGSIDLGGCTATIQVRDGTFTAASSWLLPFINGNVVVQGNTATPGNCIVNCAGSDVPFTFTGCAVTLQGFKLVSASGTLVSITGGTVSLGAMEYGATTKTQIGVSANAVVNMTANYTISGGGAAHIAFNGGGQVIYSSGLTVTLTGTPAFTTAFLNGARGGDVSLVNTAFSGSATGIRYQLEDTSDVRTSTFQDIDSYLPGDQLGSIVSSNNSGRAFRNLLMNASGRLQQGPAGACNDDAYGLHNRWYALTQTASVTPSTVTDVAAGTPHMLRLTQSQAAAQRMGYAQIIEGQNCKRYRGRNMTLSGKLQCSAATTIRYAILEWTGTEDAVTSDVVNSWTSGTFTPGNFFIAANLNVVASSFVALSANTLTSLTKLTAQLGNSFNNLIIVYWTNSTQAQNVTLDAVLQFEPGTWPTPQEPRPISLEEEVCAWYAEYKTVQSQNGARHIPLRRKRVTPTVTVGVGSAASITTDGFELSHTSAAACSVAAVAEL